MDIIAKSKVVKVRKESATIPGFMLSVKSRDLSVIKDYIAKAKTGKLSLGGAIRFDLNALLLFHKFVYHLTPSPLEKILVL